MYALNTYCKECMKKASKISVIFSVLLLLQGCINPFNKNKMVFRFVDYNCKPIPNAEMTIIDFSRGYLSSGVKISELTTDEKGFVVYSKKYDAVRIMQRKHRNKDHTFKRRFMGYHGRDVDLSLVLNHSSKETPLYIYPYDIARRRQTTQQSHRLIIHPDKEVGYRISDHGNSTNNITKLHIREMGDNFVIKMISPKNTGLIAIAKSELPFSEQLPVKGYKRELIWRIPKSTVYPKTEQSVFYFKNSSIKGVLTLDFSVFNNQFYKNEIIINEFIDAIPIKAANKLPQESCGGVADRYYQGHYGHIYETYSLRKGLEAEPISLVAKDKYEQMDIREAKAKDVHTNDQWFVDEKLDERLSLIAMDNNADISGRLEVLFNKNKSIVDEGKTKKFKHPRIITKLATDLRTPSHVLTKIYKTGLNRSAKINLLGNPKTPQKIANKLAMTLLESLSEIQGYDRFIFSSSVAKSLFKKNSVSVSTLNKVIKLYPGVFFAEYKAYRDKRVNPNVLKSLYEIVKERKGLVGSAISWLLANPNTPKSILLDIYAAEGVSVNLLNHPQFPKEVFYELYKSKKNFKFLALSINTPINIWEKIIQKEAKNRGISSNTQYIAQNTAVPNSVLKKLPKHYFREMIQNKGLTTKELADYFSDFKDEKMIKKYALSLTNNENTPTAILQKIYFNGWGAGNLAKNRNTPIKILHAIYDKNDSYALTLASHPNIDEALANKLINQRQTSKIIKALLNNPGVPVNIIWRIYKRDFIITDTSYSSHAVSEEALYCNPSTPNKIRDQLPYRLDSGCRN